MIKTHNKSFVGGSKQEKPTKGKKKLINKNLVEDDDSLSFGGDDANCEFEE